MKLWPKRRGVGASQACCTYLTVLFPASYLQLREAEARARDAEGKVVALGGELNRN